MKSRANALHLGGFLAILVISVSIFAFLLSMRCNRQRTDNLIESPVDAGREPRRHTAHANTVSDGVEAPATGTTRKPGPPGASKEPNALGQGPGPGKEPAGTTTPNKEPSVATPATNGASTAQSDAQREEADVRNRGRAIEGGLQQHVEAWDKTTEYVRRVLKHPETATFPAFGDPETMIVPGETYKVHGHVDAKNDRGETVRDRFICVLRPIGEGNWINEAISISENGEGLGRLFDARKELQTDLEPSRKESPRSPAESTGQSASRETMIQELMTKYRITHCAAAVLIGAVQQGDVGKETLMNILNHYQVTEQGRTVTDKDWEKIAKELREIVKSTKNTTPGK